MKSERAKKFVEAHALDTGGLERILGHIRIVGADLEAEGLGLGRQRAWDIAEADEAQHLAFEPAQRHDRRHFPAAGLHELVGERHLAGEREQQRHGVVGHFAQAIVRHVVDGDAAFLGRRQVDIVDAEAEAADGLAARELAQQRRR